MKGKPNGRIVSAQQNGRSDAEAVAISILGSFASSSPRLERFLALTGLSVETLRDAAAEPGFLVAVLDHVCAHEPLLIEIATETGIDPAAISAARARLSPGDTEWPG